jgi:hypothetical protein
MSSNWPDSNHSLYQYVDINSSIVTSLLNDTNIIKTEDSDAHIE